MDLHLLYFATVVSSLPLVVCMCSVCVCLVCVCVLVCVDDYNPCKRSPVECTLWLCWGYFLLLWPGHGGMTADLMTRFRDMVLRLPTRTIWRSALRLCMCLFVCEANTDINNHAKSHGSFLLCYHFEVTLFKEICVLCVFAEILCYYCISCVHSVCQNFFRVVCAWCDGDISLYSGFLRASKKRWTALWDA